MRPNLLHPLGERHSRRHRRGRGAGGVEPAREPTREPGREPMREPASKSVVAACDPAVARVRAAGGPVDQASYSCHCGCVFSAAVSTTVTCPHCNADQAW